MSPEASGLGKLIWARRTVKRMTQKELAKAVGVSRSAINEWESGRTKSLRGENLYRLAAVLDMNAEGILGALGLRLPVEDTKGGTVETMAAIERAIRDDPDLDQAQKDGLILSAKLLVAPHVEDARRRKKERSEKRRPA
jgi:transcriptional regulator with XRE-family HTH domain